MVSRWPVLFSVDITPDDVDRNGLISDDAAERVAEQASASYFELCSTVAAGDLRLQSSDIRRGSASPTDVVTVSAGVVEVFRDRFALSVRIRPSGSDGIVADVSRTFSTRADLPIEMRDEFIALARNASFVH